MKTLAILAAAALGLAGCATLPQPVPPEYYARTSCTTLADLLTHWQDGVDRINARFDARGELYNDGNEGMRRSTLRHYAEHRKTIEAVHAKRC